MLNEKDTYEYSIGIYAVSLISNAFVHGLQKDTTHAIVRVGSNYEIISKSGKLSVFMEGSTILEFKLFFLKACLCSFNL